ncbi:PIN domain nuclease [Ramlibacter sp.]|uniref:type II toxin-antitoxin system VapC family toxin n=1 Tax=Ramlibacter sp. TaxID=1917967 RepID=UPI0026211288|nr:PIN domain nuclease [Ramlibacter sp.]MDB5956866.1 PilT protein domain protein [Ramlibacter sp.]
MLVVDSGVWIDFFGGAATPQSRTLHRLLDEGEVRIVVPDLVLYEVLRGFRHEREFRQARLLMGALDVETAGGAGMAIEAAQHYRALRAAGFTLRSGMDVLIASFCIENGYTLLHRGRDFDAFEQVRGLRTWRH